MPLDGSLGSGGNYPSIPWPASFDPVGCGSFLCTWAPVWGGVTEGKLWGILLSFLFNDRWNCRRGATCWFGRHGGGKNNTWQNTNIYFHCCPRRRTDEESGVIGGGSVNQFCDHYTETDDWYDRDAANGWGSLLANKKICAIGMKKRGDSGGKYNPPSKKTKQRAVFWTLDWCRRQT